MWSWIAVAGLWTCSKLSARLIIMFFARTITPGKYKQTCYSLAPSFCIFILSTCESTKMLLKTCIHLLLPSTAEPGSWKCANTSLEPILFILLFSITKTFRAHSYEIYLRFYHVTGLKQGQTWFSCSLYSFHSEQAEQKSSALEHLCWRTLEYSIFWCGADRTVTWPVPK